MTVFIRFKFVSLQVSDSITNAIYKLLTEDHSVDSSSDTHITIHVYSNNLELDFSAIPNLVITAIEITKHS